MIKSANRMEANRMGAGWRQNGSRLETDWRKQVKDNWGQVKGHRLERFDHNVVLINQSLSKGLRVII